VDKRSLSEQDICTQFITPAIQRAGWNLALQVRQEVTFTAGRIVVRGKLVLVQAKTGRLYPLL
jgi:type I restriction enzyme, R subunit